MYQIATPAASAIRNSAAANFGGTGGLGIGTVLVVLAISYFTGINPSVLLGGAQILDRAFTGFAALPEKASQPWRETLGLQGEGVISIEVVESRFKELARKHHPDVGGDAEKFRELVEARDAARLEVARG